MVQRNFMNRGPTINQLAEAEKARRARKAAATAQALGQPAQVNTANTAQANAVSTEAAAQPAQPKSAVIGTDARGRAIVATAPKTNVNSLQAAQQIQAQNQPAKTVSTAQLANTQKSGYVPPGRQSRGGPVNPNSKWAVKGSSRLSEFQANEAAARASALQNAAINNNIIGGSGHVRGGESSYYDVDSSLADIYKQAQSAGVSISRPKTYGKTVSDSGQAQAILNAYVKSANDAIAAKSKASTTSGSSGAYFDVDSSLNSVYNQAKSAGVTITKPKTYGKSVTSERQAQSIIDSYVKTANDAISAKSKSSAAAGGSGEYYDVDSSLNNLYNQAKSAGVNVSKPKTYGTSIKTDAAAKAAYNDYYNTVNKAYESYNATNTANARKQAIKNSIDDADRALTHSDREEMAKWNRENKNMYDINKTINPAYMYWLKHGSSGTAAPPKYYEDAINEDYDKWASRDSANAARESQVAASQAKLQASYDAVQKNPGTTHAKNSKVVIANQKAVSKAPSTVTSSPTNKKLTVISAADSKKVQVAQTAARKAEVKSANESAAKAKSVASDAKNESAAYNKAILQKQAEIKKTANPSAKSALKSELKSLQKEANDSKKRADVADSAATAAVNYSKAASALAGTQTASRSEATAMKKLNVAATKVESTKAAAVKAGVQDHTGQILLKDGTWINKVQRTGKSGAGEGLVRAYTKAEFEDAVKSGAKALEEAKKASDAYLEAHGTLNNIEISGGRNVTERNVRIIGAKDAEGRQYVQSASSVYDLQKTANQKITAAMERRANAGSRADANKIGAITGARQWLSDNKISLDAKTVANTPITSETKESEAKVINKARDRVTAGMKFAEKTQYLTGLRSLDYEAERANADYHAAVKTATDENGNLRYNISDEETFKKDMARINKATAGMTEAQKKKYLTESAAKGLQSTGKASDVWRFLNTDITEAVKIAGSLEGIRDGLGGKPALSVRWDPRGAKVDKNLAGVVKSGSTADVIDNISRKQLSGTPLTAAETSLLAQINGGYKTGSTARAISNKADSATEWAQGKMQSIHKEYKAGDRFIGVPLTTNLAEWANELQHGSINAIGAVGGAISAAPKVAGYAWSQAKGVKSVDDAKRAGSNIALSGGLAASTMGRGMQKQFETDKSQFIIDMALAQAAFSGASKAIVKPAKYAVKQTALKTGVTRAQALGSEHIPYKEAGSTLDAIRYNKKITGVHASQIRDKTSKQVYTSAPGNTIYVEPGTFGAKGRFFTLSDKYVDPYGKYFTEKSKPRFRETRGWLKARANEAASDFEPVTSKVVKTTRYIDDEGVIRYRKTYQNQKVQNAVNAVSKVKSTASKNVLVKTGSKIGSKIKQRELNRLQRSPRTREKVVDVMTGDTVKLSKTQWDKIYQKFSRDGNFWDEYKSITEIAQKQADKLQRPVAVPSPKVAKGWTEAENEVFWIFPKKGIKITSRQRIGKTEHGVDIYDVRYGKQAAVKQKSLAQRMKENREYNRQIVKAVDGKKYNLNYIKSYADDANRRLGELYGNKLTRPRAYEEGAHGKVHTEQVGRNITKQKVTDSTDMDYWLGVMHDVTKVGPRESAGIPHAVAAAEVIKRGMITDARFSKFYNGLSKAQQNAFVKAISEHTTIKPINRHLLTEWNLSLKKGSDLRSPMHSIKERASTLRAGVKTSIKARPSTMSKALANADRMELTRFGDKTLKRMTFQNLKREKAGSSVTSKTVDDVKSKLSKMSERKSATFASRAKIYEQRTRAHRSAAKGAKAEPAREVRKKSQYEYKKPNSASRAGLYAAAGYHKSYKGFAADLNKMYGYTKTGTKSTVYAYTKPGAKSGYGYTNGTKSKAYPSAYKKNDYKPAGTVYGKKTGESYRKAPNYKQPKAYVVNPRSYYVPGTGYNNPYPGKYDPKPSAYTSPYTGKYTPKPGSYNAVYNNKYTPVPGGYGGNYGGNDGYTGGNTDNYGGIAVFIDKSPLVPKKKKPQEATSRKRVKADVRLTRDIKNRLGSLESMFDVGRKSQAKRKSSSVTSTKKAIPSKGAVKPAKRSTRG